MFIQATVSCECGCVSRIEFQRKGDKFKCPNCHKEMNHDAFQSLTAMMGSFSDWNQDILKNASGLGDPQMRVISLSIADLEG